MINVLGEDVRFFHSKKKGVDRVFIDHPAFLSKVRSSVCWYILRQLQSSIARNVSCSVFVCLVITSPSTLRASPAAAGARWCNPVAPE